MTGPSRITSPAIPWSEMTRLLPRPRARTGRGSAAKRFGDQIEIRHAIDLGEHLGRSAELVGRYAVKRYVRADQTGVDERGPAHR